MPENTAAETRTDTTNLHSEEKGTPLYWDYDQNHFDRGSPPTWDNLGRVKRKLRIISNGSSFGSSTLAGSQALAPEVHPPVEGLEVCAPYSRNSQPGLEVYSGPQIIYKNWDTELDQKVVVGPGPPPPPPSPTILGLRRKIFWLVVICLALVLLVGVGVGVAVGVTRKNSSAEAQPASSSTTGVGDQSSTGSHLPPSPQIATETVSVTLASDQVTTASHPVGTSMSTFSSQPGASKSTVAAKLSSSSQVVSPPATSSADGSKESVEKVTVTSVRTEQPSATDTPKSEAPPATVTVTPASPSSPTAAPAPLHTGGSCLGTDGSTYTDPDTGSQWKIECDIAHQGKDIENYEASSMEACVSMCANESACVGAIWYSAGPQGTDLNYCWLKKTLEDNLKDTKDAQSVVRL
ncbi:hypothetical protein F5Y05DRAFT_27074 [Hypoxylon sp. FL0543]|nr:hypothetical protein F5Y05DRAFT_27074 [Hypoxylon sp. FL0543]